MPPLNLAGLFSSAGKGLANSASKAVGAVGGVAQQTANAVGTAGKVVADKALGAASTAGALGKTVANKSLNTAGTFAKNYAGFGQGGNLEGASLLQHTSSPLRPPTPSYWPKAVPTPSQLTHSAVESLSNSGPIGNAAVTALRAGKNIATTSPLTPALETIKPGLGRYGAPLTATAMTGAAGYAGATYLPNKINQSLQEAGLQDQDILNKQWWSTMKAQPKLLYHAYAPVWAGGDPTRAAKLPGQFMSNVMKDPSLDHYEHPPFTPGKLVVSPLQAAVTTALQGYVQGNMDYNTGPGLGRTLKNTLQDAIQEGIYKDDLRQSPVLKDLRDAVHPDVVNYFKDKNNRTWLADVAAWRGLHNIDHPAAQVALDMYPSHREIKLLEDPQFRDQMKRTFQNPAFYKDQGQTGFRQLILTPLQQSAIKHLSQPATARIPGS